MELKSFRKEMKTVNENNNENMENENIANENVANENTANDNIANENVEDTFSLPLDFIKHDNELFMLKVSGESMIKAVIYND